MEIVFDKCAGLDVHKASVHVCIRLAKGKKAEGLKAVFGTFTSELKRLSQFLRQHQVRRVVMESTGVYWIPVWNVLERENWKFSLVLVNATHVKALPGKKTDQMDCERLAELGQYNLLRGSFIPPKAIRQLRDLTRSRSRLQGDRNRVLNRTGRLLQTANIKLSSVVSDIWGKTGVLILTELARGEDSPYKLAELAQGSLKSKEKELALALDGFVDEHFRWRLTDLLMQLAALDRRMEELEQRIRRQAEPYEELIQRLCTLPGVQEITAWTIVAELGTDMSQFADAAHLASWAGLCPGNCESAGKRQSGQTPKGNRYLRRALVQSGWAAARIKQGAMKDLFYRIAGRRGIKRATVAVAHRLLIIAYFIIRDGGKYRDPEMPTGTSSHQVTKMKKKLNRLGFDVILRERRAVVASRSSHPLPSLLKGRCKCKRWGKVCIHQNITASDAPT